MGLRPYDALMPSSAVSAKIGTARTAMSLRHQREYQRFQSARANPANAAGTQIQAASSTGPPKTSSTLTAVQRTPAPTIAPTMRRTMTVSTHDQPGPRPRRYTKTAAASAYTVIRNGPSITLMRSTRSHTVAPSASGRMRTA